MLGAAALRNGAGGMEGPLPSRDKSPGTAGRN